MMPPFWRRRGSTRKACAGREDSFVEELFAAAPGLGVPLLAAEFPRAWCDANREPWELDPAMFADALPDYANTTSPRVAAGLGTVARIVGAGEPIYGKKLRFAEAKARIDTCWRPFHEALAQLIEETVARFGHCLVLDCHSMPTPLGRMAARADIVLGDGHGTSCGPAWTDFVESVLRRPWLPRAPQRPLCRRLHHPPLRPPARGRAGAAAGACARACI